MSIEHPKTPGEAIRARCLECCCEQVSEIAKCTARTPETAPGCADPAGCHLWPYRNRETGVDHSRQAKLPSRLKSIKAECHNCMGNSGERFRLVRECDSIDCPLWPYREGHNPAAKATPHRLRALEIARAAKGKGKVPAC